MGTRTVPGFLLLVLVLPLVAAAEQDWTIRRDADGIEVATRSVPDSPHAEVRARMRLDVPLPAIAALLRDKAIAPEWIAYCAESRVLATDGAAQTLTYTHNAMPWPVRDREIVMRVRWSREPESGVVQMEARADPEAGPRDPDRVRITDARTAWRLTPLPDGRVDVEFRSHVDPASPMPAWLLNRLLVKAPHETLTRMRALLAAGRYRSATPEFLAALPAAAP